MIKSIFRFFTLHLSPKRIEGIIYLRALEEIGYDRAVNDNMTKFERSVYESLSHIYFHLSGPFIDEKPSPRFLRPYQVLREWFSSKKDLKKRLEDYEFMYKTLQEDGHELYSFCSVLPKPNRLKDYPEILQYEPYYHPAYWYGYRTTRLVILHRIIKRLNKKVYTKAN